MPWSLFTSQHDFIILHTVKMIEERGLNGSFAFVNGLRNTLDLSDIPLDALHVIVQILSKGL